VDVDVDVVADDRSSVQAADHRLDKNNVVGAIKPRP
jgi:hypothetical protein